MPDKDGSVYSFMDKELLNINTSIKQICRLDRTARRQSRDPGIGLSGRPRLQDYYPWLHYVTPLLIGIALVRLKESV